MQDKIVVGIVGSGAMGTGIAQVVALAGYPVKIYDRDYQATQRAVEKLSHYIFRLAEKQKITHKEAETALGRITVIKDLNDFADCGLVIEAIIEHLQAKRELLVDLERITGKECILATNTSSLSVAAIASAANYPERVIGIHFFNPAPLMKLVEIIPAVQTSVATKETTIDWVKSLGKTGALAKDTPGFIVNRVARPFYGEALRIYEEGIADPATIDRAMTEIGGFKMGPFTLMDYIGHDVNFAVTKSVYKAFYYDPRYRPSFAQQRMVEAGYLGRKTGKGFYDYNEDSSLPTVNGNRQLLKSIFNRILIMLINEAADAVHYGIGTVEDIDQAMTLGVNYPKGLLRWSDEIGVDACVFRMDELYHLYHEDRYRCSPLLRRMGALSGSFYPS